MDGEGVHIHLGEDGVQVHEGADIGDVKHQDAAYAAFLITGDVAAQLLNRFRRRALGQAHAQDPAAQVQDVPAFQ